MRVFILLSLLVLGPVVRSTVVNADKVGIDFYHFWMPAKAIAASAQPLGSPYGDSAAFADAMNAEADAIWSSVRAGPKATHGMAQARAELERVYARVGPVKREMLEANADFLVANARRRTVDLTATPLLYAACAALPSNYGSAVGVFGVLKFLCFLVGTALLWRARGGPWMQGAFLGLVLMLLFLPYRDDLNVGNLGSLHLLFAALPLFVFSRWLPVDMAAGAGGGRAGAAVLALLALYVMLKPNFALMAAGIGVCVVARLGRRAAIRAAVWALPWVVLLALWPCLYFGSFSVWFDWLAYIGADADKLAYSIKKHNLSTPLHFVDWWGGTWPPYSWAIGGFLLATFGGIVALAAGDGLGARLRRVFAVVVGDVFVAATLGLVVMLATAPLVWNHYMVIAVVPLAWAARGNRLRGEFWWVLMSLYLYSHAFLPLLSSAGWLAGNADEVRPWVALAWLPMWVGLLWFVRRASRPGVATTDRL